MESLLVSACLLGFECKYSGGHNKMPEEALETLGERYMLVPVCPEVEGGLPTPRIPAERVGNRVLNKLGTDVTIQYVKGAALAVERAQSHGCASALLKERSPSCGSGTIYDGTFTGTTIPGDGVAAEALREAGVTVYGETKWKELLQDGTERNP